MRTKKAVGLYGFMLNVLYFMMDDAFVCRLHHSLDHEKAKNGSYMKKSKVASMMK